MGKFLARQVFNWRATMAFSIIGWYWWESKHKLNFYFPLQLVVIRQGADLLAFNLETLDLLELA